MVPSFSLFFFFLVGAFVVSQSTPVDPPDNHLPATAINEYTNSDKVPRKKMNPPLLIQFRRHAKYSEAYGNDNDDDGDAIPIETTNSYQRRRNENHSKRLSSPYERTQDEGFVRRSQDGSLRSGEVNAKVREYTERVDRVSEYLRKRLLAFASAETRADPTNIMASTRRVAADSWGLGGRPNRRNGGFGDTLKNPMVQSIFGTLMGGSISQDTRAQTTLGGIAGRIADFVTFPILGDTVSKAARGGIQGATDSIVQGLRKYIFGRL